MQEALKEEVHWQRDRIQIVANGLIGIYRRTLPVIALERWRIFEDDVAASILGRDTKIQEVELRGPNFILAFRGPRNALIPIITESGVEWRQREPRFVCYVNVVGDQYHALNEKLSEANRRIIGDAQDRFNLSVLTDPLRLIFPKGKFAHTRLVRGRVMLDD